MSDPIASRPKATEADDIKSLASQLPGGKLQYQNIGAQQAHRRAIARWPLLAELHDTQGHQDILSPETRAHNLAT